LQGAANVRLMAERELTKNFLMLWVHKCKKTITIDVDTIEKFIKNLTITIRMPVGYSVCRNPEFFL